MSAKWYTDSKGNGQYVLHQEYSMSCGPASVAMVESYYKRKCLIDPEGKARRLSQKYKGAFTKAGGTKIANLESVLRAEGVLASTTLVSPELVYTYLTWYATESTPVIVHIQWNDTDAHFAVCKQVYKDGTAIILDPWYGLVELGKDEAPKYVVTEKDGTTNKGKLSGRMVLSYR